MRDGEVTDANIDNRECLEHYKAPCLASSRISTNHQLTSINNAINDRKINRDQKKDRLNHEHLQWAQDSTIK